MNKSFEAQVMRVLNDMVKAGTVLATKLSTGEIGYTLKTRSKIKPISSTNKSSAAAHKAWATRRKNAKLKTVRKNAARKAVVTKAKKKELHTKQTTAAYKAWDTRRASANNPLLRGKFAK
jgi:hypothetical protein